MSPPASSVPLAAHLAVDDTVVRCDERLAQLPTLLAHVPYLAQRAAAHDVWWFLLTDSHGEPLLWRSTLSETGRERRWVATAASAWHWPLLLARLLPDWIHELLQPVTAIASFSNATLRVIQPAAQRPAAPDDRDKEVTWIQSINDSAGTLTDELRRWRRVVDVAARWPSTLVPLRDLVEQHAPRAALARRDWVIVDDTDSADFSRASSPPAVAATATVASPISAATVPLSSLVGLLGFLGAVDQEMTARASAERCQLEIDERNQRVTVTYFGYEQQRVLHQGWWAQPIVLSPPEIASVRRSLIGTAADVETVVE